LLYFSSRFRQYRNLQANVGSSPKDVIKDDNLAPKIALKSLETASRLLSLVGKPIYVFILYFLNITGRLYEGKIPRLHFKFPNKGLKKSGIIFSSRNLKTKLILNRFKKRIQSILNTNRKFLRNFRSNSKEFTWKIQVFFLAVRKLVSKLDLWKKLLLIPLKLKLILIRSLNLIPKPTFPRISRVKWALLSLTSIFALTFSTGVLFWYYILKDLPTPEVLTQRQTPVSTKIYDRNGILLYNIYKDQNRTPVKLDEIPLHIRLATIAIEDSEFYSHPGFSAKGIARAVIKNFKEKKLTGGSTITQQLVKNTLLTPEKTLVRKLKEVTLAIQVELTYSKDEILEMYLNEVSYGGTSYGVQEAARTYFGKDAKNLSLGEAALLAGLPKSPTEFSPFGTNPDFAFSRQKEVFNLMQVNGFINSDQKSQAESEEIKFVDQKTDIKAPHFVMYVRQLLEETYGKTPIESGGLEITTTLDYQIQTLAEKVVKEEVEKLAKLNVTNAAALVLNPQTGEILAMVGSKNYFDTEHDGNVNVTTRLRQPGSSIKVINYAHALSNGLTPVSLVNDSPITFNVEGQPPYTPTNYEGGYRGTITIRSALAESRNIPAVKVLASYGVIKMIEMGQKMGITTWENPDNYGLSLTLGGGEVKLIDLARAYATIANYGRRQELISMLKVTDYKGKVLEEYKCKGNQIEQVKLVNQVDQEEKGLINSVQATESALKIEADNKEACGGEQVVDPRVAFIITDILHDNNARAPSFGTNSLLVIPNHKEVAVKTGTSNDLRDNLAIGYNQKYLVAVWVGNNDNSPMARIASGVTGATPIWNKIMSALLAQEENHDWEIPEGLTQLPICPYTGTLACDGCPVKQEWFLEENKPTKACSPEWFKKPESPEPVEGIMEEDIKPTPESQYINPGQFIDQLLQERFGKKKKPKERN